MMALPAPTVEPLVGVRHMHDVVRALGRIGLRARSDTSEETEILVLRHQLAGLLRRTPRPTWTDRALIAALTRLLLKPRRSG
jgi:hypothetical protein